MWAMKASVLIQHRGVRIAVKFLAPAMLVGAIVYRVKFALFPVAAPETTPATIEEHE